jgi:hypothetical protein
MFWVDDCLVAKLGLVIMVLFTVFYVDEMLVKFKTRSNNLNGAWRTTQDNSTTTVHMALA